MNNKNLQAETEHFLNNTPDRARLKAYLDALADSAYRQGAEVALEVHDAYFQNENGIITIAELRETPSGKARYVHITDDEFDSYRAGALADALNYAKIDTSPVPE